MGTEGRSVGPGCGGMEETVGGGVGYVPFSWPRFSHATPDKPREGE